MPTVWGARRMRCLEARGAECWGNGTAGQPGTQAGTSGCAGHQDAQIALASTAGREGMPVGQGEVPGAGLTWQAGS